MANKTEADEVELKIILKEIEKLETQLNQVMSFVTKIKKQIEPTEKNINNLSKAFSKLSKIKLAGFTASIYALGKKIRSLTDESNEYIESMNLFRVSMGNLADEAQSFVDNFSSKLGLDPAPVMKYVGDFNSLAKTFGITNDQAIIMAENLTQLAYDISSFRNIEVEEAMEKIRSGFVGEIEPMRAIGIALDQATLQETAYTLGINQRIETMTRAQKTELLYYQMMSKTTMMQGDLARTLIQPANALRVFDQQIVQLKRSIGNIFIPMIMKILPYLELFVQELNKLATAIASIFGFEIDTSAWDNISYGETAIAAIGDTADETTKSLKKMLAPFDELNVVDFGDTSNATSTGFGGSLDIPLLQYDATEGAVSNGLEEIRENLSKISPLLKSIGATILLITGLGLVGLIAKLIGKIKGLLEVFGLLKGKVGGVLLAFEGLSLAIASFVDIWENGFNWISDGLMLLGVALLTVGAIILGAPAFITAIIGLIVAMVAQLVILIKKNWNEIVKFFEDVWLGIKLGAQAVGQWISDKFKQAWDTVVGVWNTVVDWFSDVWQGIKNVFGSVATWFGDNFRKAWEVIKGIWNVVVDWFSKVWQGIKNVFSSVGQWFGNIFTNAWEGIKTAWNNATDFFSDVWQGIKDVFGSVATWFRDVFSEAWEAVLKVFSKGGEIFNGIKEAIGDVLKTVVNAIIRGINTVIRTPLQGLNNILTKLRSINILGLEPFSWIKTFSIPQIPEFAEGGFPTEGDFFLANEEGPEYIGSIGNRTAVANNDQIVEGITEGVKQGVAEAMAGNSRATNVYIGNRKVYAGYGSYANSENNMYGTNVIRV